jgi:hypothetical protein
MTYDPNRHRGNAFYDRALNAFFCSTWRFSCLLTFSWFLSLSFSVLVSLRCFLGFPCCVWCRYCTALRMLSATIKHCYKRYLLVDRIHDAFVQAFWLLRMVTQKYSLNSRHWLTESNHTQYTCQLQFSQARNLKAVYKGHISLGIVRQVPKNGGPSTVRAGILGSGYTVIHTSIQIGPCD